MPNYELEATGEGLWRRGQEELTEPYVERYFDELPGTVQARSGWLLADAAQAFFPVTSLSERTRDARRRADRPEGLDLSLRRRLVDLTDELERKLAVRRAFGPASGGRRT